MNYQKHIPTSEFAKALGVQSNTVRRGLCMHGHYMGVEPRKAPNGRLLWPEDTLGRILGQAQDQK